MATDTLVSVCTQGDVTQLQQLLSSNPSALEHTTQGGVTLLMHTIIGAGTEVNPNGRYLETSQLLMQYGIQLETADVNNGRTAAHWAVYYHRDDILTQLILAGSDMTCPDFQGLSPFHLAIAEGAVECLAQCLRLLPQEILVIPDAQLRLPLHHAVAIGNLEACQILLAAGAAIDQAEEVTGSTALHLAAQLGQGLLIELLLNNGAQPQLLDTSGLSPVHIAATCDSVEGGLGAIVRVVDDGDVLEVKDERGLTPLLTACAYGSEHNVKYLLKKKVELGVVDSEGKGALHWAAGSATPTASNTIQLLLKKKRGLLESRDNFGRTPLHLCAMSGGVEALQTLHEMGCAMEAVDDEQRTAVHWASVSGNYPLLPRLLAAGCLMDAGDVKGATPIHYAVQHTPEPYPDLYEPEDYEQILEQCKNVQACLAILLDKGANVTLADADGVTALHLAAQLPNNLEAMSALLAKGANPVARDNQGMTAFHVAALQGLTENCQLLLEYTGGIHGNDVDGTGRSAVHLAVMSGSVECVMRLCELGLAVDQSDQEERMPLHVAASLGSLELVQLLLSYGAPISSTGAGPAHEAAAQGHAEVLECLLHAGAPVNATTSEGVTSLHYAVAAGHVTCVQMLVEHNADVNAPATTKQGTAMPLDFCPEGHEEMRELLLSLGACGTLTQPEIAKSALSDTTAQPEIAELSPGDNTKPETAESAYGNTTQPEIAKLALPGDDASSTQSEEPKSEGSVSVPNIRPHTPIRPLQESGPTFDIPASVPVGAVSPVRPPTPKKANLLQRALGLLKRNKQGEEDSIASSTMGLYAAHATLLTGIFIGTPLGDKTVEIAHKVATDTAEDLKRAAADNSALPDLVWLREEVPPTPSPPPPPSIHTPTPPPPSPPPVEIHEDPYERRLRKARAQLGTEKSAGYLVMEELLRAQDTQARLRRQFEREQHEEQLRAAREEFQSREVIAKEASEKVVRRLTERMSKVQQVSEEMNAEIEIQLQQAREENDNLSTLMARMGLSPRPTVAQWIKQKDAQKKAALQTRLINWDRARADRQTALLLQQAHISQRALRHAAWGAKKEISERIRKLKQAYEPHNFTITSHPLPSLGTPQPNLPQPQPTVKYRNKIPLRTTTATPTSLRSSVRATPSGFYKMGEGPKPTVLSSSENMWSAGRDYADGRHTLTPSQSRAMGPKNVHAERTLHFVSPEDYAARKRGLKKVLHHQSEGRVQRSKSKSSITITSIDFKTKALKRRSSFSGPHFVSHGLSSPSPRQAKEAPIFPMTVLDPYTLTPVAS